MSYKLESFAHILNELGCKNILWSNEISELTEENAIILHKSLEKLIEQKEFQKLNNPDFYKFLKEIILSIKIKSSYGIKDGIFWIKESAYRTLVYLYSNNKDKSTIEFIIKQLEVEKHSWIIYSILSGISWCWIHDDINIDVIIKLCYHRSHLVRDYAIQALGNIFIPWVESALINIAENTDDEDVLAYVCISLRKAGTQKSFDSMKAIGEKMLPSCPECIPYMLAEVGSIHDLPFLIKILEKNRNKMNALDGVIKFWGISEVGTIIQRVKQFISRKRIIEIVYYGNDDTNFIQAMRFLSQYSQQEHLIWTLYQNIVSKKMDMLFEQEKKWIQENKDLFIKK